MKKIIGLKKAISEYRRCNSGDPYDSHYGILMFDFKSGELWVDEFVASNHCSYTNYRSNTIINLSFLMTEDGYEVNMKNVKKYIEENIEEWEQKYLKDKGEEK